MIRGKSHTPFETEITKRKGSNPYAMKLKQQQYNYLTVPSDGLQDLGKIVFLTWIE